MKEILQLNGLDCAACATELEKQISCIEGINAASIAFVSQKLTIDYQTEQAKQAAIATANAFEEVRVVEDTQVTGQKKKTLDKKWWEILLAACLLTAGILLELLTSHWAWKIVWGACYAAAYLCVAHRILISTVKNLSKGKIFDENFLMAVASIGAALLGEYSEAVLVMLLYQIGETLQAAAVETSRRSVTELMQLKSERATAFRGREQCDLAPEEIVVGDILLVKSGEKVPVDGVLIDRIAMLDTKSLTGEAQVREAKTGETLLSGCINAGNAFTMRATHCYHDSAAKKILDLVENASFSKAAPEKFITKFARWYTPTVCVLALALAFLVPAMTGISTDGRFYLKDFARWAQSALTFLVISCPCALVISVPLTYFSGIGACARQGILTKGATYLDVMAKAKTIAFDKTGTMTEGNFSVIDVRTNDGVDPDDLLRLVAAVEKASAHPIAKAFEHLSSPYVAADVQERAGRGLIAQVDGEEVLVGTVELLRERGVAFKRLRGAYTMLYVAKAGKWLGMVEVGDKLRDNVKQTLSQLKDSGVNRLVMLTGDNEERAYKIANKVGVSEVYAELLPHEKWKKAEELQKQGTLVYVGDGINDAPVMAASDCAVSMGKIGSAAAVEASDFVLIRDDLSALPTCIKISRKTRSIVLQNIIFSIAMKAVFMLLGVLGILPLWLAVFADVGVMLLAVANSFRVRK